jgi:hypothetical protein
MPIDASSIGLLIAMGLYLVYGYRPTYEQSQWIDSWVGYGVLLLIVVGVQWATNQPLCTMVAVLCAVQTMWYASNITGSSAYKHKYATHLPSWKPQPMATPMPYTLEQEIINTKVPNHFSSSTEVDPTYMVNPIATTTHSRNAVTLYDILPEQ